MKPPIKLQISLPANPRVKVVGSFSELLSSRFENGVNAFCWLRSLEGDFDEIVEKLGKLNRITTLDEEDLLGLELSDAGQAARRILIEDQRLLCDAGLDPILDCIPAYPRDEKGGPVPVDVYSFHADRANAETDTYLCSYNQAASEGLLNEEAIRRIDDPDTRRLLLERFDGTDGDEFSDFLKENFFDLHYAPIASARPYSFGLGNIWRIATDYPGSPVPPCIHRAPTTAPGHPPRLLLVS